MYSKKQRIAAIFGIALLLLLYLVTLICAIFNFDGTGRLFQACLFATIAIPILIWIYVWLFGKMTGKHTMADFDLKENNDKETEQETPSATISKRSGNK